MKFTKGPWTAEQSPEKAIGFGFEINAPSVEAAICLVDGNGQSAEELEANARLIAEAPAMFEALQACLSSDFDCTDEYANQATHKIRENARAVLARVMGEPCEPKIERTAEDRARFSRDMARIDRQQFEQWRDENLELLRTLYRQIFNLPPYQSFPDFCRQQWESREDARKKL